MKNNIDYETAKYVLDTIRDALEGGGTINWAVIGRAQEQCRAILREGNSE